MAAYAALLSLTKVIDLILSQEQKYVRFCSREKMMSLHEEIGCLQNLLEHLSGSSDSSADVLEGRCRDVAYQLEDIIEEASIKPDISIPSHDVDVPSKISFLGKFKSLFCIQSSTVAETPSPVAKTPSIVTEPPKTPSPVAETPNTPSPVPETPSAFDMSAREVSMLLKEAMEMKDDKLQDKDASRPRPPLTTTTSSSDQAPTAKMDLNEVPIDIMDWIFRRGSKLEIVPITGMGGIGKTTLARAVYQHPNTLRHFDICCWVTVSQEFNVKEILRGLLSSEQQNVSGERLIECVHKRLIGRRYLIVLDDMWDEKAWDGVRNAFPNDNKGSRIILSTRLLDVAAYVGSSSHVHEMQFLGDKQSWDLLREKVGGYELWSKKLEDLGRTISRNCRGLPLAIVAMAGLLKFNMTEAFWKQVARDTKSAANYDDHLLDILSLSYTNLPPYLKACFLYLGSYREDYEIPTKELVRLLTAEGFLKPKGSKDMEEVAEEYLEELVSRSLVLVKKKRPDGRIKTCSLHDVVRKLSLRKAQQERFFQHITRSSSWMDRYSNNDMRRAIVDAGCISKELFHHTHLRSLRCIGYAGQMSGIRHFRLVRVLGGQVCITREPQLSILFELVNLRYLHIFLYPQGHALPLTFGESISNLKNLETLIFSGTGYDNEEVWIDTGNTLLLPSKIWEMSRLRHLILVEGSRLQCQATLGEINCSSLQTLTNVTNFDLTRSVTAKLSNLKKLKLCYSYYMSSLSLDNLVHLLQLEELTVASDVDTGVTDLSFPHKLQKLSLEWTRISVEKMSVIGLLPKLEVLKLKEHAVKAEEWEPIEGEFVQLKYLKMEKLMLKEWRAESEHFPQLETIIIRKCENLKEVPAVIGEIDTLQTLVLDDCKAAEESVKEIKAEQANLCNDSLQVIIV